MVNMEFVDIAKTKELTEERRRNNQSDDYELEKYMLPPEKDLSAELLKYRPIMEQLSSFQNYKTQPLPTQNNSNKKEPKKSKAAGNKRQQKARKVKDKTEKREKVEVKLSSNKK